MIRSVVQVPQAVMDKIQFSNKPKPHEIKILKDLCAILEPFEAATNASQGQNVVTSSEVIIIVRTLREQLDTLSKDYSCKLLSTLRQSVDTRLSKFEAMEVFQIAAVLNPRYKLDWCTDSEVDKIKHTLVKKAEELHQQTSTTSEQEDTPPPSKKARPQFMKDRSGISIQKRGAIAEVTDYFLHSCTTDEVDPLGFWKDNVDL